MTSPDQTALLWRLESADFFGQINIQVKFALNSLILTKIDSSRLSRNGCRAMTELQSILTPHHLRSLEWFRDNTGVVEGWPTPFADENQFVVNKAKGIHKPAGSDHALSVRISADNYSNTGPDIYADDTWKLIYHEERRTNATDPGGFATNRGLLKCLEDKIPIGVMKQISGKPETKYRIFGLGFVTDYSDGFFVIEGPVDLNVGGQTSDNENAAEVLPEHVSDDDRQRVLAEVIRRRGQGKFRRDLLQAYSGRCAVTNCDVTEILDAAHILPHTGSASNCVQNGILLRTDIHTLFDLGLLTIQPDTFEVRLHPELARSDQYVAFDCTRLSLPGLLTDHPSSALLQRKLEQRESS
jgi:putative restriction endonuclease